MLESNLSELEEHLKHTYSHWYALVLKGKQTNFAIQFKDRFFHADLFPITNKELCKNNISFIDLFTPMC